MKLTIGNLFGNTAAKYRALRSAQQRGNLALERLSTGKRINRGSDDPAGLVAAEGFRSSIASIEKQLETIEVGFTRLGALDGVYSVATDLAIELEGAVVRAANTAGLGENELDAIQVEVNSILEGLSKVFLTASVGNQQLFRGTDFNLIGTKDVTVTTTDENGNEIESIKRYDLRNLKEFLEADPEAVQDLVEGLTKQYATRRGEIGNNVRSLESRRNVLLSELETYTGALSNIEDTNIAEETSALVRSQLLEQTSISAILIERQSAETVLSLIESAVESGRSIAAAATQ